MTIKEWLEKQKKQYKKDYLALDAELILCDVLGGVDRSYLISSCDQKLTVSQSVRASGMLEQRIKDKMPLAYVLQEKEFYGRKFFVNSSVLIPRPETEALIDIVKEIIQNDENGGEKSNKKGKNSKLDGDGWQIADIGTGSSCIATTLKLELPKAEVFATDISPVALEVAKKNAKNLGAEITFAESDLFENIMFSPKKSEEELKEEEEFLKSIGEENYSIKYLDADKVIVVANLPYVDPDWDWVKKEDLQYEPEVALYAENGGLSEITHFLFEVLSSAEAVARELGEEDEKPGSKKHPRRTFYVVLELDPSQKPRLDRYMTIDTEHQDWRGSAEMGFYKIKDLKTLKTSDYAAVFKITII